MDENEKLNAFELAQIKIRENLEKLDEKERQILSARFGLDDGISKTLEEVSECFETNIDEIRKIEKKMLDIWKNEDARKKIVEFVKNNPNLEKLNILVTASEALDELLALYLEVEYPAIPKFLESLEPYLNDVNEMCKELTGKEASVKDLADAIFSFTNNDHFDEYKKWVKN